MGDIRDMRNIILIGFMGSGKSSVGTRLANELGFEFIDTDKEIERTSQMDIPSIFKKYGEHHFRSAETAVLKSLGARQNVVISTGGGTPIRNENWKILSSLGLIVNLFVTLDTAILRTGGKGRPLLQQDRAQLERMWEKRQLIYQLADHTINTEDRNIEEIIQYLLKLQRNML